MDIQNLASAKFFTTKDGSEIRELLSHRNSGIRHQSLAEARIAPGLTRTPHYHPKTEEIYYIVAGSGLMTIDGNNNWSGRRMQFRFLQERPIKFTIAAMTNWFCYAAVAPVTKTTIRFFSNLNEFAIELSQVFGTGGMMTFGDLVSWTILRGDRHASSKIS
jgi:hypothetical protein